MADKDRNQEPQQQQAPESPTMPEPETPAAAPESDYTETLKVLEEMNKTSPDDVRGMYEASQQYGHLQNLLGQSREEVRQLRAMLEQQGHRPPASEPYGEDEYAQAQSRQVDLRGELKAAVRDVVGEMSRENQERMQWYDGQVQKAKNSKYYRIVGDDFERRLNDRANQQRIWQGQVTPTEILAEAALEKLTGLATQLGSQVQNLPQVAGNVQPPHMEQGQTQTPPQQTVDDQRNERLQQIQNNWSGGDEDVDALLDVFLGGQSPSG